MSNQRNQPERGRELTLKETSTASLLSRRDILLGQIPANWGGGAVRAEIDSIEQELEERNEWESKVSRW